MIPGIREAFNASYTEETYLAMVDFIKNSYPNLLDFRIGETPVFFDQRLTQMLLDASEKIVDVVTGPGFTESSKDAIPPQMLVPGPEGRCHFMAFDFGICYDENGALVPRLIELQGFPTLFGFQEFLGRAFASHYPITDQFNMYFGGLKHASYVELLKKVIVGDHDPVHVVLMDARPEEQKTRIDFHIMQSYLGIPIVDFYGIKAIGNKLYYARDGKDIPIHRIFNRLIFDDLKLREEQPSFDIFKAYDVEWITHPNWFYRISKYTMPFLDFDFVPHTRFVSDITTYPNDLENYVLKPLYSFSGQGVIIDVTPKDLDEIVDKGNWILQRKVKYAPAVLSPEGGVQCEIRMIYLWEDGKPRPEPALNLMRLSRGKMIGVRYNKDLNWVGSSMGFFEK
jgi:hypothetical protein